MKQEKEVLKIKIYQPEAHYRIPFSYQRRFTYPIPPYSTIKGLICNLLGIKSESDEKFKLIKELSLAIYGRYESLIKEYIWFRNLEKESHISRFHVVTNRTIDNVPQHQGGQMPVTVDVLHNVNLLIYIYHPDENFLNCIKGAIEKPSNRLSTIHLGRAEDWLVLEEINYITLQQKPLQGFTYFAWIPEKKFANYDFIDEMYDDFFQSLNGNLFNIPTFYEINDSNKRIFNEYVTAKLYEGGSFKRSIFYMDCSENIPIIFTILKSKNDAGDSGKKQSIK